MEFAEVRTLKPEETRYLTDGIFYANFTAWLKTQGPRNPTVVLARESRPQNHSRIYRGQFLAIDDDQGSLTQKGMLRVATERDRLLISFGVDFFPEEDFVYGLKRSHETVRGLFGNRINLFMAYDLFGQNTKKYSPLLLTTDLIEGIFLPKFPNQTLEMKIDETPRDIKEGMSREELVSYLRQKVEERVKEYEKQKLRLTCQELAERLETTAKTINVTASSFRMKGGIGNTLREGTRVVFSCRDTSYLLHRPKGKRYYYPSEDLSDIFNVSQGQAEVLRVASLKLGSVRVLYDEVYAGIDQSQQENGNLNNRVLLYALAEQLGVDPSEVYAVADKDKIGPLGTLNISSVDKSEAERIKAEIEANDTGA